MISALEKMEENLSYKLLWSEALHELTKAKRRKQSAGAPRKSHALLAECVDDVLVGAVENQTERVRIAQALIRNLLDPKCKLEVEQLRNTVRSARARKRGGWRGMKAESGSLWKEVRSIDVGKVPKPQARKIQRALDLPKAKKRSSKKP